MGDREAKMGRMSRRQTEGQRAATTSPTLGLKTGKNIYTVYVQFD